MNDNDGLAEAEEQRIPRYSITYGMVQNIANKHALYLYTILYSILYYYIYH
jgi:hypothetical protein